MSPVTLLSRRLITALAILVVLQPLMSAQPWPSQLDQRGAIDVNDPRPLASAVEVLEQRHGWVITYEDPPYLYAPDISDVTAQVRRDLSSEPRVLIPKGGSFHFTYVLPSAASPAEASAVLTALLEEYHRSGNSGVFKVVQTATAFHIVPSTFMDTQGRSQATSSLLDVKISTGGEEQTGLQMLQGVIGAISRATGARIWLGSAPLNLLMQTRINETATTASARMILMRLLAATRRSLSWQIFCAPGPVRDCALNVYEVRKSVSQFP
jgi:hypothetical protein